MKKYLSIAAIALLFSAACAVASLNDAALEAKEKAAWQAFKDKKADDFKKVVAANLIGVYDNGVSDMAKELSDMQKWDMKSFTISNYKVTMTGSDTAVSTYTVKVEGTFDGKDASETMNAGSVWKQQNGEWMAIFHTNVAQAEPAG